MESKKHTDKIAPFNHATVKRIMQKDDDVGRISKEVSQYTSFVAKEFIIDLTKMAQIEMNKQTDQKKITKEHILAAINKHERFDFIELDRDEHDDNE